MNFEFRNRSPQTLHQRAPSFGGCETTIWLGSPTLYIARAVLKIGTTIEVHPIELKKLGTHPALFRSNDLLLLPSVATLDEARELLRLWAIAHIEWAVGGKP
jgi:hypothetical protein